MEQNMKKNNVNKQANNQKFQKKNQKQKNVGNNQPKAKVETRPINPNDKFGRNIAEMKALLEKKEFKIEQAEGSKKIFAKKTLEDGTISSLLLIPMGVDSWISECEVLSKNGKSLHKNSFKFSFRATKDIVIQYA